MNFVSILWRVSCVVLLWSSSAGAQSPVAWQTRTEHISPWDVVLVTEAQMAPGWCIYSVANGDNGPPPTRFQYRASGNFRLAGKTEEHGGFTRYYDDVFESEVASAPGVVRYTQRLQLLVPETTVEASVNYLVCNDHTCIPAQHDLFFSIKP